MTAQRQCPCSNGKDQDCLSTVTTLPWTTRSPDLSPIEHIWDHLGQRVGYSTSLNELEQIWNEISQDIIQNLYECPIVSHRAFKLEGFQQCLKPSIQLPFSLK
ncbi:transposable element Tcb1 transposase [Trichonephila clavipes]|nr:transposable element Tcb1 transposase [Trichonephila clavipes]